MDWWSRVKSLFAQADTSSRTRPVLHESLDRHRERAAELATWRHGIVREAISNWLRQAYGEFLLGGQPHDEAIDFLSTPSAKGFVVHFDRLQYSIYEAEMFQLHLRDRVLAEAETVLPSAATPLPYRTQIADSKTYSAEGHTERTDRYYLKPRLEPNADPALAGAPDTYTADQFGQGYGNILIELVVRNEQPFRLKFSATIYHDRVYREAAGFGALMEVLLA